MWGLTAPLPVTHTVSLQCFARNWNTIQVMYSLHFKLWGGSTCGHQGFSQTCLLAATAQHLVASSTWMHPCCQELCGTPGPYSVEIHSSLGILPWIFSPSPTESPSAPDFYHSLGVCRLNPHSKRPSSWRTVFVRSRGKPLDRWLSRQGKRCAEQVSDVNDSTEYLLFLEQEKKIIIRANG